MFYDGSGQNVVLGSELGKGGAATVYLHAFDDATAVKIFRPEVLQVEINLAKRIERLNALAQIADIRLDFGKEVKTIGAWPKDTVKDVRGNVVGYMMDTVHGGIDLSHIVMARNPQSAFYKYRNHPNYDTWVSSFVYQPRSLRNRFIIAYYLAVFFEKMYDLKNANGVRIDLSICNFDIKPQNVLVYLEKIGRKKYIIPYVLDLDNVTLRNKTQNLEPLNKQITPEYSAKEGPVDQYYDYYSIAVIFHQLIFDLHPFMISNAGGQQFRAGTEFTYFRDNYCYPWGRNRSKLDPQLQNDAKWGNFTKVSSEIQQLFLKAFDSNLPSDRPNMGDWKKALGDFLQNTAINFERIFYFW